MSAFPNEVNIVCKWYMYVNEMTGWNDHKSMSILLSIYSATYSIASYINSTVRDDICDAEYSSFVG